MTLVAWAEGAEPPALLIARKSAGNGESERERPICAYPALPEYRDIAAAGS